MFPTYSKVRATIKVGSTGEEVGFVVGETVGFAVVGGLVGFAVVGEFEGAGVGLSVGFYTTGMQLLCGTTWEYK